MTETLEETSLHLPKNNSGLGGVVLSEDDFFVLKQLLIQYSMESNSLHSLYIFLAGGKRNRNSITNRLRKLVEAGVLIRKKEMVVGGAFVYHYRLGTRGLDVLVRLKVTSQKEAERIKNQTKRLGVPRQHTKATSKLANNVFIEYTEHPNIPVDEVVHKRGAAHHLFGANPNLELKGLIIPDWVFERGNLYICLEIDTGSEGIRSKVASKYKRYIKLAEEVKKEGKVIIVIFNIIDKSVLTRVEEDKKKRLTSIKDSFPLFHEWPENLHIYTVSANRVPKLVSRILTYRDPSSAFEQKLFMDEWTEQLMAHSTSRQPYVKYALDDIYGVSRDKRMDVNVVVSMPLGNMDKLFSVLYAEEGSVRSYQLIRTNLLRNKIYNDSHNDQPIHLLVCYENEERLKGNINGLNPVSPLMETDFVSWREWNGQHKLPTVHVSKSAFKRVEGVIE